jgi:radical SAM superfamily enzyme YgiQ (UPF0313 family)
MSLGERGDNRILKRGTFWEVGDMPNDRVTRVYLADLAHCASVPDTALPIPLSIGYVAAYAKAYFGDAIDIRLFKHPEKLLEAIHSTPPHVVGFANYGWNANLNLTIGKYVRALVPDALIVAGGPNLDADPERRKAYLRQHDYVHYLVVDGGEEPFAELIDWWRTRNGDTGSLPRNLIFMDKSGELISTPERPLTKTVEGIRSPYLGGFLDEFLAAGMVPMLETNRGCPFRCTFCAWGMASKDLVRRLDLDTALAEIAYIGERSKARNWIVCDANFGILPRDVEIAKAIRSVKDARGSPDKCHIWLAKNTTQRNVEIAAILGDMVVPVMAVQSLNDDVLKNIKRSNIKTDTYRDYQQRFHKIGHRTYSDLIVPLPGETLASHFDALRTLFDLDVDIIMNHNMRLLAGAETNSTETRERFRFRTRYRLIHGDAGAYRTPSRETLRVFEYEESLRETDSMTEDELFFLRKLHFLVDFCWNIEAYRPLLRVLRTRGRNPLDVLLRLLDPEVAARHPRISDFWRAFDAESNAEWFDTPEEIERHFGDQKNWESLVGLEFEKLNTKFGVVLLRDFKRDFDAAIEDIVADPELDPVRRYAFALFPPLDLTDGDQTVDLPSDFARIDDLDRPDLPSSSARIQVRMKPARGRDAIKRLLYGESARTVTLSKLLNTAGVTLRELRYTVAEFDAIGRRTSRVGHRENTHTA